MLAITTYTAVILGRSWVMLQKRWPEYRETCRKPYPEIGRRALGQRVRFTVSVCINATQFGIAVVYLLLSAKNIHDFLKSFFNADLGYCIIIMIVALLLLPVTFLKSPQDFWWAVVIAMCTTSLAVILILIGSGLDYSTCNPVSTMPDSKATNYFLALGTMLFAYGGHAAFPTIQHDMKKPKEFTKASLLCFGVIALMYYPVSAIGYMTYGDSLRDSVINSLQTIRIQQAINILITVHCLLTLTIVFSPINQEMEEFFKVPHHFGYQRVLTRSAMMLAVVFVAESVPTFGPLLQLIGGSTLTLTSICFPSLFYLYLSAMKEPEKPSTQDYEQPGWKQVIKRTPKLTLTINCLVIAFGLFGGAAATYSAIRALTSTKFAAPCYVAPFLKDLSNDDGGHTNCCGHFMNVTRFPDQECSKFTPDFYN